MHIVNGTTTADKRRYTPGEIVMKMLTKSANQFKGTAKTCNVSSIYGKQEYGKMQI